MQLAGYATGLILSAAIPCQRPLPELIEISPQSNPGVPLSSNPSGFFDAFGAAYFAADDQVNGVELWRSNSSSGGTRLVTDLRPGAEGSLGGDRGLAMISFRGRLMFAARPGQVDELRLWETDGSSAGTSMLPGAPPLDMSDGRPGFGLLNDRLLFIAKGPNGSELWSSDGSSSGSVKLLDLDFDPAQGSNPFVEFRGALYFAARSDSHGQELWKTDGSAAGTQMVADLFSGSVPGSPGSPASSYPTHLTPMGQELLIVAQSDLSQGHELWSSDGTTAGTVRIGPGDLQVQPIASYRGEIHQLEPVLVDGTAYFVAGRGGDGPELYRYDGSSVAKVADITPGPVSSQPVELCAMDGFVLFVANDGVNGRELWRSDGTAPGTVMVKDIWPGSTGSAPRTSEPHGLMRIGSRRAYFAANDGLNGTELWVSDGSLDGTRMIADLEAGSASSAPVLLGLSRGRLYFSAETRRTGRELWVLDPNATTKVIGHGCGAAGYIPTAFADDPVLGRSITVGGDNAEPGAIIVVLALGRLAHETPVVNGCSIYLDNFLVLTPPLVLNNGGWQITAPLNFSPAFAGVQLGFQALIWPTTNVPGWALTPALQFSFDTF